MATTEVDVKKLLEAGAHFGHKTSRWHPKMSSYIHSKRGGIHIIDLLQTAKAIDEANKFITETVASGKQVLLVGTKKQSRSIIEKLAKETNMPYVTERWIGGTLTNWNTIGSRVKQLKDLEARMASGELVSKYNKLEVQRYQEQIDYMNLIYGGVKEMSSRPGALFVVDIVDNALAVKEATKLGIPVVGIADTNSDPTTVKYPIPANDDAIKTIQLIADYIKGAIENGKSKIKN